jgi:hypothetical protein
MENKYKSTIGFNYFVGHKLLLDHLVFDQDVLGNHIQV